MPTNTTPTTITIDVTRDLESESDLNNFFTGQKSGIFTIGSQLVKFAGVHDLANFLADSPETHDAFVEHLFHHVVQQPVRAYGADRPAQLRTTFDAGGCSIRNLLAEIAATTALTSNAGKGS